MNDFVLTYTITLAFICVLGGLFCVYRYYLGNRMIDQAAKLKSQMAKIRQDFPELERNRGEMVAGAIGDIGIDGIIDELGLPKVVTPFVKGFLSNPENINKIMGFLKDKGFNMNEKGSNANTQTQETNLL